MTSGNPGPKTLFSPASPSERGPPRVPLECGPQSTLPPAPGALHTQLKKCSSSPDGWGLRSPEAPGQVPSPIRQSIFRLSSLICFKICFLLCCS